MRSLLLTLAAALATGGCAAEAVLRGPLPAFGHEVVTRKDGRESGYDVEGRRRFWAAYLAGQPAEFVSTSTSVEGDPVTEYYRVLGPGRVEILHDATKDRFGSGKWERYTCRSLRLVPNGPVDPFFAGDNSCVQTSGR